MKKSFIKDNPERVLGAVALFVAGILILGTLGFGLIRFTVSDGESDKTENKSSVIININTASEEELARLEGISDVLSKKIVDYREKNGKFNSVDDLKNVEGIGQKKIDNIRKYVKAE